MPAFKAINRDKVSLASLTWGAVIRTGRLGEVTNVETDPTGCIAGGIMPCTKGVKAPCSPTCQSNPHCPNYQESNESTVL